MPDIGSFAAKAGRGINMASVGVVGGAPAGDVVGDWAGAIAPFTCANISCFILRLWSGLCGLGSRRILVEKTRKAPFSSEIHLWQPATGKKQGTIGGDGPCKMRWYDRVTK